MTFLAVVWYVVAKVVYNTVSAGKIIFKPVLQAIDFTPVHNVITVILPVANVVGHGFSALGAISNTVVLGLETVDNLLHMTSEPMRSIGAGSQNMNLIVGYINPGLRLLSILISVTAKVLRITGSCLSFPFRHPAAFREQYRLVHDCFESADLTSVACETITEDVKDFMGTAW